MLTFNQTKELARMVKERWPALKIVLTSGFPQARAGKSWRPHCEPRSAARRRWSSG